LIEDILAAREGLDFRAMFLERGLWPHTVAVGEAIIKRFP
jgi:hypothetical protein